MAGCSTAPRTAEGLARLATARTTHGADGAANRAAHRSQRTLIVRCRLSAAAAQLRPYLPRDIAARLTLGAPELAAPLPPPLSRRRS